MFTVSWIFLSWGAKEFCPRTIETICNQFKKKSFLRANEDITKGFVIFIFSITFKYGNIETIN